MLNQKPLVSIITITYNRCDLIHRCIESIQGQTYSNYEHIIVDGNSNDRTESVVSNYNDPHIKYIKLKDKGPQLQMSAGTAIATGKYVTFLDDDDEYLPEKIQKQVEFFETLPEDIGLTYCWMSYYMNDNPDKVVKIHKPEFRGDCHVIAAAENRISGTPTLMVRRELIEKVGGVYNDQKCALMGADVDFATRLCQITKVDYIPESLVKVYLSHGHARLSTNFYSDYVHKNIRYHEYFLSEFHEIFDENPKLANYHLFYIARFNFLAREYKQGFIALRKLLKTNPSIKQIFKVISALIIMK